ncbi:MAG: 1-deoxy-D-xylulose-5-phosphate reductoisomerase [Deltaproteobacteria bacterium]|jgi:1-deoxy-D-xylulose-5-phosphate reductoisomerase|nr:1-deoxy-D-xylulose-5-phosphate reductoisomerase [Deltaproteobacteria bacterium]MBW2483301.1 1-deoxy-D-xylulose-5-phosphate reductoisomerase [Deltaproteobacteria bacterium]
MKRLSILGSTGSIGTNVLNIVAMFPQEFDVKALAARKNVELLARQIEQFHPDVVAVFDEQRAQELKDHLPPGTAVDIMYGDDGYRTAAAHAAADMTVTALVGAAGLQPTLAAIDAGKTIALANKETLVMAGDHVMKAAAAKGVAILPIDSEHSAIFQCLQGQRQEDVDKILLTASGGPFLNKPKAEFKDITIEDALNHPNWQMGRKITIDSATLMNKGLEVLEARCLFGVSHQMIEVVIHPQSVIHSMVAYKDGSVIAQLGIPDMKGAIAYALSYPQRLPLQQPLPQFDAHQTLTFQEPDLKKFPCLAMAFEACEAGGTLPSVLNAANEVAVHAFLNRQIGFVDIVTVIRQTIDRHPVISDPELSEIMAADQWAREGAQEVIEDLKDK